MRQPKNKSLRILIEKLREKIIEKREKSCSSQCKSIPNPSDLSRRKFITDGAKGAMALALASSLPFLQSCDAPSDQNDRDTVNKSKSHPNITIIGAGMAGLNCAYQLQKQGITAQVFEGSTRLGGRILTHYNDSMGLGIYPEFGGDFIDSSHEDMLNLAKEFELELIDLESEMKSHKLVPEVYYFNNRNLSEKEIIAEFSKISDKIASDIQSLGEDYTTEDAKRLDQMPMSAYIEALPCSKWMKQLLTASFEAEYGMISSEQSTLNMLDMINPNTESGFKVFGDSDERYRIKGGNSKIIEALAGKLDKKNVHMGHMLSLLENAPKGQYKLTFANGKEIATDIVLLAIPFSMLRKVKFNLSEMTPQKKKCIDELGFGNNTKLVLAFEGRPWRDGPARATGRVTQEHITNGWDGSYTAIKNNPNGAYVCYFGGKFSDDLNKVATRNPVSPPTHVWRTELPKEKVAQLTKELNRSFPGTEKKFLNKHVFVNWIDFPYTLGSYSCYKTGQWSTIAGEEKKPIGQIYFAGEHCSRNFQGFMNGAAETGREAAEVILKEIKS